MMTPWKGRLHGWQDTPWIADSEGKDIAQAHGPNDGFSVARAHALIHRANAYPKLVEALEQIRAIKPEKCSDPLDAAISAIEIAREALASTREEG